MGIIIISILIPITVVLLALLAFILRRLISNNNRKKMLSRINDDLRIERITNLEKQISRIGVVTRNSPKFSDVFNELEKYFNHIERDVSYVRREFDQLAIEWNKMKTREFSEKMRDLSDIIGRINELENKFNAISGKIMQKEEFLSSEHTFYSKQLREAIAVYREKRIILNNISDKIDDFSMKINEKSKKFNEALDMADNNLALKRLEEYSKAVYDFVSVISKSPNLNTYINSIIPKALEKLVSSYEERKKMLNDTLGHISFKESIMKMSKIYKQAKQQYLSLDVEDAEKSVRDMLKSIKTISKLINFEIISRNFFSANYEKTITHVKISLRNFVSLKQSLKAIVSRGHKISYELNDTIVIIESFVKEVDSGLRKLMDIHNSMEIPFSSKVSRMKMLMRKTLSLTEEINKAHKLLWTINIESSILKNKYKKIEAAMNELLSNVNSEDIILSQDEIETKDFLSDKIVGISKSIEDGEVNKEVKTQIEDLVSKTSSFYSVVGGKIKLAEIIRNLIKEFSPDRATTPSLNIALNNAERTYLDGQYAESLNIVITELEKGGR